MSKLEMKGKVLKKTQKTLNVLVIKHSVARIYGKLVKRTKKYLVHNPTDAYEIGDMVSVRECRPISKMKYFEVVGKAE